MKKILVFILFIHFSSVSTSQIPDWSTSIATIIYNHCSSCHHSGGIAPFALMTYEDAVDNAISIQTYINSKLMPPWPPDPNYRHFTNENVLSDIELNNLNSWIDNGTPSGDLNLAPPQPEFPIGSLMVNPDDTIILPVFEIPFEPDVYWNFVNHSDYTETKYINSIELVKGNMAAIHHSQIQFDTSSLSWQDDVNYAGPGYPQSVATSPYINFFGADQTHILTLPPNMGFEIPAGSDYVTYLHYTPTSAGQKDSSRINIKFCKVPDVRPVNSALLLYNETPCLQDGPFKIPANTVKTFHLKSIQFFTYKSLLAIGVHSHQVCTSWEVYMVTFTGDTVPLLKIPHWDFRWQGAYLLTQVIKIPAGSVVYGTVTMDNTSNNPNNPSNPPIDVEGGTSSYDEMARARLVMMDYQVGDENIILDSVNYTGENNKDVVKGNLFEVYPNPASENLKINYTGNKVPSMSFFIYNYRGELLFSKVENNFTGKVSYKFDCSDFVQGIYFIEAQDGNTASMKKFIVAR